ncbi:MAG TPA: permease prefix domain 2-containing transporter [Candidatus Elarobacter sp.]|nr:permease prefix domain 2-containing transporter [Candidatus Elarobacter sp.]
MTRPPRAAAWLLERVLPRGARDAAIGDLNEEFAAVVRDAGSAPARRWYWIQTFSLIRALPRRDGDVPRPSVRFPCVPEATP